MEYVRTETVLSVGEWSSPRTSVVSFPMSFQIRLFPPIFFYEQDPETKSPHESNFPVQLHFYFVFENFGPPFPKEKSFDF